MNDQTTSHAAKTVAFVGLGVMGFPMAGHLATAGYNVRVFNRTAGRAKQWITQHSGVACKSPASAAHSAQVVCLCVGNDEDVRSVVFGPDGVLESIQPGSLLIDHTTASAELAVQVASAADERGIHWLDAPVSGGESGAINGQLTIMAGGTEEAFSLAQALFSSYGKQYRLMGPAGAGQLTKMVNQICIAGILQSLSEGIVFAECVGLNVNEVIDVISQGAAQSWQMDNRGDTMAARKFDFGFAVDWMRKDLAIALQAGRQVGAPLPLTALIDQFYGDVQAQGGNRLDTSSLILRLAAHASDAC